jgi:hypothetical protein
MNCRRIEKLIPLYVEGDLEGGEAAAVLAHAETCGNCRELVAGYEASQRWLRSHTPPDFNDALFDAVKRGVMKEIDEKAKRPSLFGFFADHWTPRLVFIATAALLIIFVALTLRFYSGKATAVSSPVDLADTAPAPLAAPQPDDVEKAPRAIFNDHDYKIKKRASSAPIKKSLTASNRNYIEARSHQPERLVAQEKVELPEVMTNTETNTEANAEEVLEMMRIEFQTSDPNIRIIWLSHKETDSQPLKPMTETD